MKILYKGINSQGLYVVVTDYSDNLNPNMKPHTMFYSSEESYNEYVKICKQMDDMFWQEFLYGKSVIKINN